MKRNKTFELSFCSPTQQKLKLQRKTKKWKNKQFNRSYWDKCEASIEDDSWRREHTKTAIPSNSLVNLTWQPSLELKHISEENHNKYFSCFSRIILSIWVCSSAEGAGILSLYSLEITTWQLQQRGPSVLMSAELSFRTFTIGALSPIASTLLSDGMTTSIAVA